jgi:cytoskeletal protein CcmA (bactofilin family)
MRIDKSPQSARGLGSTPTSTIAEDLVITGNVTSKGEIHLDGQVRGDIHCLSLVVSEKSQIEGNVVAEDVAIRGSIIGSVRALRVALHPQCHVVGDLFHQRTTTGMHENENGRREFPRPVPIFEMPESCASPGVLGSTPFAENGS